MSRRSQSFPPPNRRRASRPPKRHKLRRVAGRFGRRFAELSVLAASVVGLVVLARWTHAYVTTSPHFAVAEAEVAGNEQVDAETIRTLSGLVAGTNIFSVSPVEAARRIEVDPWIISARVRRRLPGEVSIEVVEREAAALLRLDQLFLVDGEGVVFKPVAPGDPSDLPIITGIDGEQLEDDRSGAGADLNEALALLRIYHESGLPRHHPLSEVHIEPDGSLSVYTLSGATHIRLGRPPFRRKLRRLARLLGELRSQQAVADYVYLEGGEGQVQPDRAVVRLRP